MDKILQVLTQVANFCSKLQQGATKILRATKYLLGDKDFRESTNSEVKCHQSKAKATKRTRQSRKV